MICENCGEELQDGTIICPACGRFVVDKKVENSLEPEQVGENKGTIVTGRKNVLPVVISVAFFCLVFALIFCVKKINELQTKMATIDNESVVEEKTEERQESDNVVEMTQNTTREVENKPTNKKPQVSIEDEIKRNIKENERVSDVLKYLKSIEYDGDFYYRGSDKYNGVIKRDHENGYNYLVYDVGDIDKVHHIVTIMIDRVPSGERGINEEIAKNEEILREKLDPEVALKAVELTGQQFYGKSFHPWKTNPFLCLKPEDENTWYMDVSCYTVKKLNETNRILVKDKEIEARVTGTNDNPEVIFFQENQH